MSLNSKRKKEQPNETPGNTLQRHHGYQEERQRTLANLRLQAYESDITRGPTAKDRARMLETPPGKGPGTALIAWGSATGSKDWLNEDSGDTFSLGSGLSSSGPQRPEISSGIVWVDRYDARLLLDSFPNVSHCESNLSPVASSPSPSAWSDLPDDAEETSMLSSEEAEDCHRVKRRRLMDEAWQRRVKERELEDEQNEAVVTPLESRLDEEPSSEVLTLMERTAAHLCSATNPAQLEMRILANHGSDERFAFLREGGRSRNVWIRTKQQARAKLAKEKELPKMGLGALAGYSSDESDDSSDGEVPPPPSPPPPIPPPPPPEAPILDKEALKASRREKARRWLEERRKERASEAA